MKWYFSKPSILKQQNLDFVYEQLKTQGICAIDQVEKNDVFIASYPKSGVTWLQFMSGFMMYGLDPSIAPGSLVNLLFPDVHQNKYYIRTQLPTLFKSHSLPTPTMKKVVHLVRDGRDVMASYYAFLERAGKKILLKDMIVKDIGLFPTNWAKHCEAWENNPYRANILSISYEEMLTSPEVTLSKYCSFVGIEIQPETIQKAISLASFSNLQKNEIRNREIGSPIPTKLFFRKGEIGSYKHEIPADLLDIFTKKSEYYLKKYRYIT
jgi:hypothetical protein